MASAGDASAAGPRCASDPLSAERQMTLFEMIAALLITLSLGLMIIEDTRDDSIRVMPLPIEV